MVFPQSATAVWQWWIQYIISWTLTEALGVVQRGLWSFLFISHSPSLTASTGWHAQHCQYVAFIRGSFDSHPDAHPGVSLPNSGSPHHSASATFPFFCQVFPILKQCYSFMWIGKNIFNHRINPSFMIRSSLTKMEAILTRIVSCLGPNLMTLIVNLFLLH